MPRSREILEGFTTERPLRGLRRSKYARFSARSAILVIGGVSLFIWICILYPIVHFVH